MPQAQTAEDESHWDDDATAKVESTNEHHNDSAMEIDSPNSNDEPNHEKGLENGYDDHQVNGDATAANHIKVENMENDSMLDDDDDHKVNGIDAEENESVNEDNNSSQPIEDSKVKTHIIWKYHIGPSSLANLLNIISFLNERLLWIEKKVYLS